MKPPYAFKSSKRPAKPPRASPAAAGLLPVRGGTDVRIRALPADRFITKPANLFDLQGKTLRFSPTGSGYRTHVMPLSFRQERGVQLQASRGVGPAHARSWKVNLPFAFPFARQSWTGVFVNLNGSLSFGESEADSWPARNPWADGGMRSVAAALDSRAAAGRERVIAALWAMYSAGATQIHVQSTPQSVAFTWVARRDAASRYPSLGVNVFQAVLYPAGIIDISYQAVGERDGIVGVFSGHPGATPELQSRRGAGKAPEAVRIASASVADAGSTLVFTLKMSQPIPDKIPSGQIAYRIFVTFAGEPREFGMSVGPLGQVACRVAGLPSPATTGFQVQGQAVSLYLSKAALGRETDLTWKADVVWWDGPPNNFDGLANATPLSLGNRPRGEVDFSQAPAFVGNAFEVFHYVSFARYPFPPLLRGVYKTYPPDDDFAVVLTDFRFDDLFAVGPATGPVNVALKGIGAGMEKPVAADYGSARLQSSFSPTFVGLPVYDRTRTVGGQLFSDYPLVTGFASHELTHRWGMQLKFKNPRTGRIEALTDPDGHWVDGLHAPRHFPDGARQETSIMGGEVWQDNHDGTFTRRAVRASQASGFSALDLYAMGLLAPAEVPDTYLLQNIADRGGGTVKARPVTVTIQDVIAAMGARVPGSVDSQKEFLLGVYLVHEPGRGPAPALVDRTRGFAAALGRHLQSATGNRMRIRYPTR